MRPFVALSLLNDFPKQLQQSNGWFNFNYKPQYCNYNAFMVQRKQECKRKIRRFLLLYLSPLSMYYITLTKFPNEVIRRHTQTHTTSGCVILRLTVRKTHTSRNATANSQKVDSTICSFENN